MSKSSVIYKQKRQQSVIEQLKNNIKQIQNQVSQFNYRQQSLPPWVKTFNKFYKDGQLTHLKQLTEPKYQLILFHQDKKYKLHQNQSNDHKKNNQNRNLIKNMTYSLYKSKTQSLKNISTISKILQTQISEDQNDMNYLNDIKEQILKKKIQLKDQWNKLDEFRQLHIVQPHFYTNRKLRIKKILEKVSSQSQNVKNPQLHKFQTSSKDKSLTSTLSKKNILLKYQKIRSISVHNRMMRTISVQR